MGGGLCCGAGALVNTRSRPRAPPVLGRGEPRAIVRFKARRADGRDSSFDFLFHHLLGSQGHRRLGRGADLERATVTGKRLRAGIVQRLDQCGDRSPAAQVPIPAIS